MKPSLRAILRRPSSVELKFRCLVSSTAQEMALGVIAPEPIRGPAATMHPSELLAKKTSRQQAVTPRFEGLKAAFGICEPASFEKSETVCAVGDGCVKAWDCHRTRTTSSGVTRRPVSRLPDVAESIFCAAVISTGSFGALSSWATVGKALGVGETEADEESSW